MLANVPQLLADLTPLRISPDFRRLWSALAVSNIGQQMTAVAVGIQVYAITGSVLAVGVLGFFQLVPLIVFGLYGGALSDTHDRRLVGLFTAAGLAACASVLVLQAFAGWGNVALLYAVVAVQSAMFAVGNPARSSITPRIIPMDLLPAANTLSMFSFNIGLTLGPLLGGLLIGITGSVTVAYVADLIAFTATLYAMLRLRPIPPLPGAPKKFGHQSVVDGLTYLKGKRNVQMSFYVDIVAMVFGMPRALFPAIAVMWFGDLSISSAGVVGLLYAAPAVGAILSSVFSGPLGHVRRQGLAVTASVIAWGLAITGFGLTRSLPLCLFFLAIAGAADNVSAIFRTTILQAATPDAYRGRLQGIFTVVVAGGPRLGDVEAGVVAAITTLGFSVISGGLACVALTLLLTAAAPSFLRYDAKNPVP